MKRAQEENEKEVEEEEEEEEEEEGDSSSCEEGPEEAVSLAPTKYDGKQEFVDVEFEFFDPHSDDYHGTRTLLCGGLWNHVSVAGVAEAVVAQVAVGTMIKVGGNEEGHKDPYGFASLLSLRDPEVRK